MEIWGGVSAIFVLTDELFNGIEGNSVAEIEFPVYYNFLIHKKKTAIWPEQTLSPQGKW